MKFIKQKDGSLNIIVADEDNYDVTDNNGVDVVLSQEQVQELKGVLCASHSNATERDKVLKILEKLVAAFYEYDMDVICEEVAKPPKHIRMINEAEAMIAELRTPAPAGDLE